MQSYRWSSRWMQSRIAIRRPMCRCEAHIQHCTRIRTISCDFKLDTILQLSDQPTYRQCRHSCGRRRQSLHRANVQRTQTKRTRNGTFRGLCRLFITRCTCPHHSWCVLVCILCLQQRRPKKRVTCVHFFFTHAGHDDVVDCSYYSQVRFREQPFHQKQFIGNIFQSKTQTLTLTQRHTCTDTALIHTNTHTDTQAHSSIRIYYSYEYAPSEQNTYTR